MQTPRSFETIRSGDTFNGGVLLVAPHQDVFEVMSRDCQLNSKWHYSTTYPESHYLKWVADW